MSSEGSSDDETGIWTRRGRAGKVRGKCEFQDLSQGVLLGYARDNGFEEENKNRMDDNDEQAVEDGQILTEHTEFADQESPTNRPSRNQLPFGSQRHPSSTPPRQVNSPLISAINSVNPFTPANPQTQSIAASSSPPGRYISPHRGGDAFVPTPTHVGTSPPPDTMKPRSIPRRQNSFGGRAYAQPISPSQPRPSTTSPHNLHLRGGSFVGNPPLPHEDQPHLHGALPDLDSFIPANIAQDTGLLPGEKGFFVGLDTLAGSGVIGGQHGNDVLVAGYEGGLTVSRISSSSRDKKGVEEIGKLEGLKGSVVSAKILPVTTRADPLKSIRPLIAIVLHSPLLVNPETRGEEEGSAVVTDSEDSQPGTPAKTRPDFAAMTSMGATDWLHIYETSVEIYSLSDQRHVSTLYTSQRMIVPADMEIPPPRPLRLDAGGNFVAITDGLSGEVFIFSYQSHLYNPSIDVSWRCVGKLWTTVCQRTFTEKVGDLDNPEYPVEEIQRVIHAPLVSISSRWIALAPPPSAGAQITAKGTPLLLKSDLNPPGLSVATAPTPPSITCNLDAQTIGFMSRVSREATQNLLKGAQWTFDRGMEAYNSYWNKTSPPQRPSSSGYGFPGDRPHSSNFPPTHGYGQAAASMEDAKLVAIYDLEQFLEVEEAKVRNVPEPLAAFAPPSGISHLSFAPGGWNLLVVNRKGDDTMLWNLMNMIYASISEIPGEGEKDDIIEPFVRHAWNTTRMSEARVIDVSWSEPRGDRLAILTDKPTVHVHDIPSSALQWPPLRKRKAKSTTQQPQQTTNDESFTSGKRWSSALETLNGAVKSVRDTSRSLSIGGVSSFAGGLTASSTAATAKSGGRMVRQGISKGLDTLTTQAQQMYYMQDNKLHLEHSLDDIAMPGLISFTSSLGALNSTSNVQGRGRNGLAVIEAGALRIYPIRQIVQHRKNDPSIYRVKISKRYHKFPLPLIPDSRFPPSFIAAVEARYSNNDSQHPTIQPNGYWAMRAPKSRFYLVEGDAKNWHAIMEAESNPPFQPFHFNRRYIQFDSAAPGHPEPSISRPQHTPEASDPDFETPAPEPIDYDAERSHYAGLRELSQNEEDEEDPQKDTDHTSTDTGPDWDALEHDAILKVQHHVDDSSDWLFGTPVTGRKVQMQSLFGGGGAREEGSEGDLSGDMENRITFEGDAGEGRIVVTTMRRRARSSAGEEFFEDGAEVVEFVD